MIKLYYIIARKICYTQAVALSTVIVGIFAVIFGYFLGTSFLTASFDQVLIQIWKWLPWVILISSVFYLIQFGLLTPVKIPAFYKFMRNINKNFYGEKLNKEINDNELKKLYKNLTYLPAYNLLHAVVYTLFLGILLFLIIYFTGLIGGSGSSTNLFTASESSSMTMDMIGRESISQMILSQFLRIIIISDAIVLIIFCMITYLITDIMTGRERAACYNELRRRNFDIKPTVLIGVRIKFSFIVVLMIISLLTFGALIEKGRFTASDNNFIIIINFAIGVSAGLILMYITANSLLIVFKDISRVAREIGAGGDAEFQVLPLEREFADIEYTILEMNREISEHRKNLERKVEERTIELRSALSNLKEKDDIIQKQLDMAGTIQKGILPGRVDDWNELQFSVRYIAMEKIGGDFYDVFQLKGNKMSIFVADVSGHGIPAALVTTMAKVSFSNAFLKHDSPKKIFQDVNQELLKNIKTQDYLTCFLVTIDEEYRVVYSNASHQKGILLRTSENKIELLDTGGLFIGAIEEARDTYEEKTTQMNYGDRLILYTDGIPEATNNKKEEYSNERFESLILKNRNLQLEEFTNSIIDDLKNFMGDALSQDDKTLLVIELVKDETVNIIKQIKTLSVENKIEESIDLLKNGLAKYPDNKKLLYNLAKNYFKLNKFDNVIDTITKYLNTDKENKFAYYLGGTAYYQIQQNEKALEFFNKAISLDPNFSNAIFAAGMVYKKNGQIAEAREKFRKVVNIDSDNKMAVFELQELDKKI